MWPYFNVLLDRFDCKYDYFIVSPYKSWLKTFFVNINDDKTIMENDNSTTYQNTNGTRDMELLTIMHVDYSDRLSIMLPLP